MGVRVPPRAHKNIKKRVIFYEIDITILVGFQSKFVEPKLKIMKNTQETKQQTNVKVEKSTEKKPRQNRKVFVYHKFDDEQKEKKH